MILIKRSYRRIIFSWGTLLVALAITIVGIRGVIDLYPKEVRSRERLVAAQKEQDDFRIRHASLSQAVSFLDTNEGIESELRKKYRVIKPGEQAVLIVDDTPRIGTSTQSESTTSAAWYSRIFEYFR